MLTTMRGFGTRILARRHFQNQLPCQVPFAGLPAVSSRQMVSTGRSPYEHVEDVERLEDYRPGGFHPIQIGDTLRERYHIAHKLGYGSFSTIWLARDKQLENYVAIKVGTADSDRKEVDIMAKLSNPVLGRESQGCALVPPVLDRFDIQGPNGYHPCLITAAARCSLSDAKGSGGLFQLGVARSLVAQLAIVVAYMHGLGYVHGGESQPWGPYCPFPMASKYSIASEIRPLTVDTCSRSPLEKHTAAVPIGT